MCVSFALDAFVLFVGYDDGVQCVFVRMAAILHNETFVTFHFDPSLLGVVGWCDGSG